MKSVIEKRNARGAHLLYLDGKRISCEKLLATLADEVRAKIVALIKAQGIAVVWGGKFVVTIIAATRILNARNQDKGYLSCSLEFTVDSVVAGLQLAACVRKIDEVQNRGGLCFAEVIDAETFYDPHYSVCSSSVMVWPSGEIQFRCSHGRLYDACCEEFGDKVWSIWPRRGLEISNFVEIRQLTAN